MQKVITINLNGHAYQLDDTAYDALRAYLNRAELQLKDNPDRAEILADIEQAIAEKCSRFLGPHKTVVTAGEIDQVLKEMGPVEATDQGAGPASGHDSRQADGSAAGARSPKRLYRIREGAMWEGVCTGLAAYFGIDVSLVRIAFGLLTFASFGSAILGYIVLVWVIPEAHTSDERAAAYGQPFNAQELIDQFKKQATDFKDHGAWKRQWREQKRQWRAQHRQWRRQWRSNVMTPPPVWGAPPIVQRPVAFRSPVVPGLLMPIFSLINLALFACLAFTIFSLVTTGFVYGWALPDGMPLWAGILILVVFYHLVTSPLQMARHSQAWGPGAGWFAAWHGLIWIGGVALLIWGLLRYMPPVHDFGEFMNYLPEAAGALWRDVSMWFQRFADSF